MRNPEPREAATAPHRGRKDRLHWCKGRKGTPHQRDFRLASWVRYMRERYPDRPTVCGWQCYYVWHGGRAVQDEKSWHWSCHHEIFCPICGKILERSMYRACPDWHPRGQAL